jgi:hypothetical protein
MRLKTGRRASSKLFPRRSVRTRIQTEKSVKTILLNFLILQESEAGASKTISFPSWSLGRRKGETIHYLITTFYLNSREQGCRRTFQLCSNLAHHYTTPLLQYSITASFNSLFLFDILYTIYYILLFTS